MSAIDFEKLCEETAKMGYEAISETFHAKSEEVMLALNTLNDEDMDGLEVYVRFLLATVAADGVLALEEYFLLRRMFDHILQMTTEFDDALWFMIDHGLKEKSMYRNLIDSMKSIIGRLDETTRNKLVEIGILLCAADGIITDDEKAWMRMIALPQESSDTDGLIDSIMSEKQHSSLQNRF